MEDNQEFHPVVKLLLARMESHPHEFEEGSPGAESLGMGDRWWRPLDRVMDWGSPEEKAAIQAALRKIKLSAAHDMVMDELCNGDERRRKYEEEQEYERNVVQTLQKKMEMQMQMQAQQTALTNSIQAHNYQNAYPPSGSFGKPLTGMGLVETVKKALGK